MLTTNNKRDVEPKQMAQEITGDLANQAILFLVRQAVQEPLNAQTDIDLFEFRFSHSQQAKLEELSEILNLSLASVVNSALCFAVEYSNRRSISIQKTRGYPNRLGKISFYSPITPTTIQRLVDAGVSERGQLQFTAVSGLHLLHRRLTKMS